MRLLPHPAHHHVCGWLLPNAHWPVSGKRSASAVRDTSAMRTSASNPTTVGVMILSLDSSRYFWEEVNPSNYIDLNSVTAFVCGNQVNKAMIRGECQERCTCEEEKLKLQCEPFSCPKYTFCAWEDEKLRSCTGESNMSTIWTM